MTLVCNTSLPRLQRLMRVPRTILLICATLSCAGVFSAPAPDGVHASFVYEGEVIDVRGGARRAEVLFRQVEASDDRGPWKWVHWLCEPNGKRAAFVQKRTWGAKEDEKYRLHYEWRVGVWDGESEFKIIGSSTSNIGVNRWIPESNSFIGYSITTVSKPSLSRKSIRERKGYRVFRELLDGGWEIERASEKMVDSLDVRQFGVEPYRKNFNLSAGRIWLGPNGRWLFEVRFTHGLSTFRTLYGYEFESREWSKIMKFD
jgi:hypothetical protein